MSYVLTLVSSSPSLPLSDKHLRHASDFVDRHSGFAVLDGPSWLDEGKAADIFVSAEMPPAMLEELRALLSRDKVDVFHLQAGNRRKKLLLADMDSTIVEGETLDDLAAYAGLKHQVSEITKLAMEGKLDFHQAIRERVALLRDLPVERLQETLEQIKLNPGAKELVSTMAQNGARCILVSGGFTFFTEAIAKQAGFHAHHGNILDIDAGKGVLTGQVVDPILDKHAKLRFLEDYMVELDLRDGDCMTIGDGANDIPMLEVAGLGVGYRPKQAVKDVVSSIIEHGDLSAALYAQGYSGLAQ